MNQLTKALCLALAAFTITSVGFAQERETERGPREEQVEKKHSPQQRIGSSRSAARKRALQRLKERGFTKEDLKRAKEVMQARREIKREGRAEGQRQRGNHSRIQRGAQRGARTVGARGVRRAVQRQRGQRGMRSQRGQRGQRRSMRGGRRAQQRQRRR